MLLAALQGREADVFALLATAINEAAAVGQGLVVSWGEFVKAILLNGLGRYGEALVAAQRASNDTRELFTSSWALPELIEAASRTVGPGHAARALELLREDTAVAGTDWGLGIAARSGALLAGGDAAESLYREAIERLGRTRLRPELARAHLLYGEWLRRQHRRLDARNELRIAHELFTGFGMAAFAERARIELEATGERARNRFGRERLELELDARAALRIDHVFHDHARELDHRRAGQLEIDAYDRADRRLSRRLEEHRATTQITTIDRRELRP